MDFLPIADWSLRMDDTYLDVFVAVHKLLQSCGKLMANIELKLESANGVGVRTQTTAIGFLMTRLIPSTLKRKLRKKEISRFSSQIGHSLDYQVMWHSSRL
ncbi:ANK3 [Symbiodinium necroappetens]|uniref:ANK3 protein n=1 Tax=Symbiodinium necroappetens TaxID=1628268 RepID=A0A812T1Y8_9DINO|nr:ANK3 [Symbiodinium necroappetens]